MVRKRLVFTLLVDSGIFQLSRNFDLQKVGDMDWLYDFFDLEAITRSTDELVLLNVSRGDDPDMAGFRSVVEGLGNKSFMPIAAGGKVRSMDDAFALFDSGADKVVVNTPLFKDPDLVRSLVGTFGGQSVVGAIDYRLEGGEAVVRDGNGSSNVGMLLDDAVRHVVSLGVGELYVTSMDRDGTGQGLDMERLKRVADLSGVPVIASGGVGDFDHIAEALRIPLVTAVSTANIFNFIGGGLSEARAHVVACGLPLATWNFSSLPQADTGDGN